MKHIKRFDDAVNEGAKLVAGSQKYTILSIKDDNKAPLEVLKTTSAQDRVHKGSGFRLYHGLTVDPTQNRMLGSSDPVFKMTIDALKKGDIVGGKGALTTFTEETARQMVIDADDRPIDYVFSMGSTAGLSNFLGEVFLEHFQKINLSRVRNEEGLPPIYKQLSKYPFKTIAHALNWDYLQDYDNGVGVVPGRNRYVFPLVKQELVRAIDLQRTRTVFGDRGTAQAAAITNSETYEELRKATDLSGYDFPDRDTYELLVEDPEGFSGDSSLNTLFPIIWIERAKVPYSIRSSGLAFLGMRKWFKSKYMTPKDSGEVGSQDFINAVEDCILKDKRMLIVDDNARSRQDLITIFRTIEQMYNAATADHKAKNKEKLEGIKSEVEKKNAELKKKSEVIGKLIDKRLSIQSGLPYKGMVEDRKKIELDIERNKNFREGLQRELAEIESRLSKINEPIERVQRGFAEWRNRIFAYVLIYIPESDKHIGVKKLATNADIENFARPTNPETGQRDPQLGLKNFSVWIQNHEKRKAMNTGASEKEIEKMTDFENYWRGDLA
jgi:hypothetical protein